MKPKIVLDSIAFRKVMYWVDKSPVEVSGLGTLRVEPNGVIRVLSAMLLPQKNGAAHTDIEPEDVNKALFALKDEPGSLRWWWHSHVNMAVFWSSTDHDTIKKIGQGGWFACTVFNKKREWRSAVFIQEGQVTPWGATSLFLDELETTINPSDEEKAEWDAEYKLNVTDKIDEDGWEQSSTGVWTKRYPQYNSGSHYYGSGYGGYQGNGYAPGQTTSPSGPTAATTGSTSGVTSHVSRLNYAANKILAEYDFTAWGIPPANKPSYMSKRVFKAWKKFHTNKQLPARPAAVLPLAHKPAENPVARIVHANQVDEYGFDQVERTLLAQSGWDLKDIDELFQLDFSPSDMVKLASADWSADDVWTLIKAGHDPQEIMACVQDDIPVADRGQEAPHGIV